MTLVRSAMIHIIPTQTSKFRTFGWVQDPSDFRKLCDVVAVFYKDSAKHREVREERIPALVLEKDGRDRLCRALDADPLRLAYADLVGTSFSPRSAARCNGIVQAVIPGQVRGFIGDWPADNFVRWAHALGFIQYHYEDDTFSISESGKKLAEAAGQGKELNKEEKAILTEAVLAYPPAVRILNLLSETEDTHLTKFELGKKLGFAGEGGFTSMPQSILIRTLAVTPDAGEKNKMKTDWDGSSDKYARMIAKWLEKLGLVQQKPKELTVRAGGQAFTESIGQAYLITAAGITALNRANGHSRHSRIAKNICFEMMATKGSDREYLRTRRTYILKVISEKGGRISVCEIKDFLQECGLEVSEETIKDDVNGLVNTGLNISTEEDTFVWRDKIHDFILPLPKQLAKSDLSERKEQIRESLTHISHEYLSLMDLAYDPKQNRLFEMKVMELLIEEGGCRGMHLGGSRRPDGICYTDSLQKNCGMIIDTKAYAKGYSLPISQADEMERYIRENRARDLQVNANGWWQSFPSEIDRFYFMFVSGHFKGNYQNQIRRLQRSTGVSGAALDIGRLLLAVNDYKAGKLSLKEMLEGFFRQDN